ncbi:MAG: FMN-dependent NADH-azoreductase, partial [Sulfitobacter sp.]
MKVLHIDSSVNLTGNSRQLTRYLVDQLVADEIVVRDVAQENLPLMSAQTLMRFYNHEEGDEANGDVLRHLALSDTHIEELVSADVVVLGVPMYNFGVPSQLKNWIDHVARRGQTFRYGKNGPEGLIGDTRVYVVASSGGTPIGSSADHASSHAAQVLSFLGATSV